MLSVIEAVIAVESLKRIPDELKDLTYFSATDEWQFFKSYHPNMCKDCDTFGAINLFTGIELRTTFPYLEIIDENTIFANVHPNCKCTLIRVSHLKQLEQQVQP